MAGGKSMQKITPCLWFDSEAEQAANFYVSVFSNSRILDVTRYGKEGFEVHGQAEGKVMTVVFEIEGQKFMALNGGPHFRFTPAISLMVDCRTQAEVDALWEKLSADPEAEQCGWLKDRFGLSWQIIPAALTEMMRDPDPQSAGRVMQAMLKMKKIDIAALEAARASA
jgi:predicted 3-demethylubiquinone-9 3-methyltransferase (glyoxalase superfamily)